MNRRKGKGHGSADFPTILNPIHHAEHASDDNFELHENVAYVTTTHNEQSTKGCCKMEEEMEKKSEEKKVSVNGNTIELTPVSPHLPFRQYLLEKEVQCISAVIIRNNILYIET